MTIHMRRASALILASALFSAGAWGQTTTLRQWATSIDVASEYFGTADGRELGRDVKGTDAAPKVVLSIHDDLDQDGTGEIGIGNIARITFTVQGAKFAETVSASNLTGMNIGSAAISTEIVSGGSTGDTSVTIEVEVTEAAITGNTVVANNYDMMAADADTTLAKLVFEVPMLQATGAVLASNPNTGQPTAVGVGVTSSIAVRRARDNPFPGRIQGADADGSRESGSESVGMKPDAIMSGQSQVYNTMMPGLALAWQGPFRSTAEVAVTDRTTIIALGAMTKDPSVKDQTQAGPALRVGMLNLSAPASVPRDLGGRDPAVVQADNSNPPNALQPADYEVGDGLSGDVEVSVSGPFQSGDKIYLGTRPMSISGGMAMGAVDVEQLLQSTGMSVIYVPGGVDDLKPSAFRATAKLDFDDSENSQSATAGPPGPPAFGASTGALAYKGFSNQGYAYGIVRGGGTDQSYARVTCESAGPCVIFADCTDQAGMSYFGGPMQVAPGATEVVSSDMLAEALEGGWEAGRGRCNMVSNGALSVQHMVRSGHTLVNNSLVVNKPVAAFPMIPGAATYDCVPMDVDGNDSVEDDEQVCSPQ